MQLENTESEIEKRRLQWVKDVELLADLCNYQIEEIRPAQIGDEGEERDNELPSLYLLRDNSDKNQLMREFPKHKNEIERLTMAAEGVLKFRDQPQIKTDSKLRISKDGSLWGTFGTLRIYSPLDNEKLFAKLAEGEIIKNFPGFLYERFEPLINEEIKGKGKVFEKIATRNCRPVKRSDLWDAWDYLRNDFKEINLERLREEQRKHDQAPNLKYVDYLDQMPSGTITQVNQELLAKKLGIAPKGMKKKANAFFNKEKRKILLKTETHWGIYETDKQFYKKITPGRKANKK